MGKVLWLGFLVRQCYPAIRCVPLLVPSLKKVLKLYTLSFFLKINKTGSFDCTSTVILVIKAIFAKNTLFIC